MVGITANSSFFRLLIQKIVMVAPSMHCSLAQRKGVERGSSELFSFVLLCAGSLFTFGVLISARKKEASALAKASLCENFHSDTLPSFLRLPGFFFIVRDIISFEILLFVLPVIKIIPDFRTMPVRIKLNVFFVYLATLLFHITYKEKIIP